MDNKKQILREAGGLFKEDVLEGLKDWYTYTLQGKWRYVVFTVRRSYIMALILETITEERMADIDSVEYLTDAALFLRCSQLADAYRKNRRFPKILLCDDVLVHGRNTNHIIEELQEELFRLLSDEFAREEIEAAFIKAIDLHVYARASGRLLLHGEYMWNLHYTREENPRFLHQLSSDISSLILCSDQANASYIYTEYLSEDWMESNRKRLIEEDGFVHTSYQHIEQYTKLTYINSDKEVKAVLSLRIIENRCFGGYRVAPFIFLPNMDQKETESITDFILGKIPEEYKTWVTGWKKMKRMRTFNEWVTLLLSDVILKDFITKKGVVVDPEEQEKELNKLTRNYNQYGFEETKQMLKKLLGGDCSICDMFELKEELKCIISGERPMMELESRADVKITEEEKIKIKERVEDYFFNRGRVDEESAYELMRLPYFPTRKRSKRRARGCCFTLNELNRGYTEQESRYCMAYFLQMIDAGIGSLSSYAPNDVTVIGYAQFAKAGEQSLLIKPLRMYVYILMLSRMQQECDRRFRELSDEVRDFGTAMHWEQSRIDMVVDFVDTLSAMGHTPKEWKGEYIDKLEGHSWDWLEVLEERSSLYHAYIDYANEKYGYR